MTNIQNGDMVRTKHGDGIVRDIDATTYSITMYVIILTTGRYIGDTLFIPDMDIIEVLDI